LKKDFNKRWVSSFEISVNFNYLPQFSFRICPDVCFLCGFCSNLHVPPMLVVPTSKKGSEYFQRAQTHAKQQSNKPFYGLFWVFLGKLRSVKVFLGVFLVCWGWLLLLFWCCCEKLMVLLLGNFYTPLFIDSTYVAVAYWIVKRSFSGLEVLNAGSFNDWFPSQNFRVYDNSTPNLFHTGTTDTAF
jgi:hypothetical protein